MPTDRTASALPDAAPARGMTTGEVAKYLRVSEDKVRHWLATGELVGINTATTLAGKPRWVITPAALAAFEARRTSTPVPKPARRRRQPELVDYFPDA